MQTPGGHCSNETSKCSMNSHRHQGTYSALEGECWWVVPVTGKSCYWDFQPAGNLKYLISFSFQLCLNFKQKLRLSLPNTVLQELGILFFGGIYILLRDTMYRAKSGFHQRYSLNSSVLHLGMFPTSQIVCFNKYSSRLFKVIQNT